MAKGVSIPEKQDMDASLKNHGKRGWPIPGSCFSFVLAKP
jgi:hypothetical protein